MAGEKSISQQEFEVCFEGPAVLSNRFLTSVIGNDVRITFCEQGARHTHFRAAVVIQKDGAVALANLLLRLAGQTQQPSEPGPEQPASATQH